MTTSVLSIRNAIGVPGSRRRKVVGASALAVAIAAALQLAPSQGAAVAAARDGGAPIGTTMAAQGLTGQALPGSFADLVEAVRPAVVTISAVSAAGGMQRSGINQGPQFKFPPGSPFERFFEDHFGKGGPHPGLPGGKAHSAGSGFIIDADGLVVTNYHVVDGAQELMVTLSDGRKLEARTVGFDEKTDIALLELQAEGPFPHVALGDSDKSRVGDWVVAVGNPFGLGGSVTAGIVSARGRDIRSGPYDDYLQIDAPINRGNSGGPLFNRAGEVVGINTAIFSPSGGNVGIAFAIPSNMADDVIDELREHGTVTRGWLGVNIQTFTEDMATGLGVKTTDGALVSMVVEDSPAERAGLEPGDVVVNFDGKPVESAKGLSRLVADTDADEKVKLGVWRDGEELTLPVAIGAMPGAENVASAAPEAMSDDTPRIGVALAALTRESRAQLGLPKGTDGVLIQQVERGSPAAERGLRPGDVILRVGRDPVSMPKDVVDAVRESASEEHDSVLLLVHRDGTDRYVSVPFIAG